MKKLWLIVLVLALFSCQEEGIKAEMETVELESQAYYEETPFADEDLDHYSIDVVLNDETKSLSAGQVITYTNRESVDLDRLYLHLYPNAFSKDGQPSIVGNTGGLEEGFGAILINELKINGEEVTFNEGPTITSVEIPFDFEMNQTYSIELKYDVQVSETSERFGYVREIYNLGNWYPIIAVYDEDGWNVDPYLSIGDPFYSDMSNYDVTVEVPKGFTVAASGYTIERTDDTNSVYKFRGDNMRDFAMVISERFEIVEEVVNDTTVMLYYPKSLSKHKWLDDALSYGVESIRFFEEIIGDYPYKTYSVVLTNFPSGMEYPGLVFISTGYLTRSLDSLRTVIVHETAHQWFYNLIGDDEIDEGWIDEGLTSYYTAFFDKYFIDDAAYELTMQGYQNRVDSYGFDNIVIAKSAYDFEDWGEYGVSAYSKSALVYHQFYKEYGEEKMKEFSKYLYDHYAYKILKEDDLRAAIIEVFGPDAENIIDTWWY